MQAAGSNRRLLVAWTLSVTAGEFLGFCAPAVVAALTLDAPVLAAVGAMVVAGSVEGAVLGWSQARVLRRTLPGLSGPRWTVATAVAAALAWLIGMLPGSTAEAWSSWPRAVVIVVALVLGSVLLLSIGTAQWWELRRHVRHARRWVATTAGAWCAGLAVFAGVTTPLWQPGQPTVQVAAIGAVGGLAMAATVALLTGVFLVRLLQRDHVWRGGTRGTPGRHPRRHAGQGRRMSALRVLFMGGSFMGGSGVISSPAPSSPSSAASFFSSSTVARARSGRSRRRRGPRVRSEGEVTVDAGPRDAEGLGDLGGAVA